MFDFLETSQQNKHHKRFNIQKTVQNKTKQILTELTLTDHLPKRSSVNKFGIYCISAKKNRKKKTHLCHENNRITRWESILYSK